MKKGRTTCRHRGSGNRLGHRDSGSDLLIDAPGVTSPYIDNRFSFPFVLPVGAGQGDILIKWPRN